MSTFVRKVIFCLIGILAGIAAWSISELILVQQVLFPTYLVFSIAMGAIFGSIMGGFFGSSEGIAISVTSKILTGIGTGMLVGVIGGGLGFLVGQGVLFLVGEMFLHSNKILVEIGAPVSRTIGWGIVGIFIGAVEGVRALSWIKIKVGILGGVIGGILGGFVLEYLQFQFPQLMVSRMIGLGILGFLIGLFYGFIETRFSQGVLKLLNGKLKGKEYLLLQRNIKIGHSGKADIQLANYQGILDIQAVITNKPEAIFIRSTDEHNPVLVNEAPVKQSKLEVDDVIQIGTAKILFFYQ